MSTNPTIVGDIRSADSMFYAVGAGFTGGIFLRSFVNFGVSFSLLLIVLGVILFLYRLLTRPPSSAPGGERRVENTFIILAAVFLFAVGAGMLRYDAADRAAHKIAFRERLGQTVSLEGVVADDPDERERVTRLLVEGVEGVGGRFLVTTNTEPKYAYGNRLLLRGKLDRPKNFIDKTTFREVDYQNYLAKDGIYYEMYLPKIDVLASGEGNFVVEKLFAFKRAFIESINRLMPSPHAALLGGIVVGAKQSLGKKLLDDFRTTGVIHIVVLSGYNITIIAYFIEWLLSRLRKNIRLAVASLAMILFALMVGASATVVRATIMALLVILARSTGRVYAVTRALLIAGFFMLIHNPKILVFDVSFQLSFLATVGLIYFSPLIEPRVLWITKKWKMREIVVATIATQLFVLPFLLYKTGTLSLVSLPVNLLILAAIPVTMFFGFLAGIAGFAASAIAAPFAFVSYALLSYELAVVELFSKFSFAAISIPYFPLWLVIFWYAVYTAGFFLWQRKKDFSVPRLTSLPPQDSFL